MCFGVMKKMIDHEIDHDFDEDDDVDFNITYLQQKE
jgi:hypothetical protein